MALAYIPPGVSIEEVVSPNVSPLLASPANVCVIGLSRGYQTRVDQFRLTDTGGVPDAIRLPGLPEDAVLRDITTVKNALDPQAGLATGGGYIPTTDFTSSTVTGTITRVLAGAIPAGTIVNVTYTYLPSNYFTATRLSEFSTVEELYGSAYAIDGNTINSPLSFAAQLAFENGAATVVCQPLFERTTPGNSSTLRRQPTDNAAAANVVTWQDTLYALRDIEDINVIVPVVGQSQANVTDAGIQTIFKATQDHIQYMRLSDQYIIGIFGEDSSLSTTVATQTTLKAHGVELASRYGGATAQNIAFVEPSRFARISPVNGRRVAVGGQYVAAGLAGMIASRPVSATINREQVSGFSEVLVSRLKADKNDMAQNGFTVIENRGPAVIVRHAITLDATTTATRELSIVRAKHRMVESIRDTIDTQIIGKIIADGAAPLVVRGAVIAVLERLRGEGDIVGYRNVDARTTQTDPTKIEVRFSYRPAFPVNYVNIVFSIDLTGDDGTTIAGT